MTVEQAFPDEARQRIAAAVHEAETSTSGEVVVALAGESDAYEEASWRAAAILGGGALVADLAYRHAAPFWLPLPQDAGLLAALAAAAVGFLAGRLPPLRRSLVGRARQTARVRAAAEAAFRTGGAGRTSGRTGVLVYVSMLERQVVVLPDIGIEAKAPESAWSGIVDRVVVGMKAGRPADGVVEAVRACGELLRAAGFAGRPDDVDELDDAPRIIGRS
jgi:putative membrane protein